MMLSGNNMTIAIWAYTLESPHLTLGWPFLFSLAQMELETSHLYSVVWTQDWTGLKESCVHHFRRLK